MIAKFFIPFIFLFSVSINAASISTFLLNSELKKNYSFIERSLHESDMKIDSSTGKIFFNNDLYDIKKIVVFGVQIRVQIGW